MTVRIDNPAPTQYDLGQLRTLAIARFGSALIDLNEVHPADGSTLIAVYLPATPNGQKASAWTNDLAAYTVSSPTALDLANAETTIDQRIDAGMAVVEQWIANNPNGAVLTGPQTLVLAKLLLGLAKSFRGVLSDINGT